MANDNSHFTDQLREEVKKALSSSCIDSLEPVMVLFEKLGVQSWEDLEHVDDKDLSEKRLLPVIQARKLIKKLKECASTEPDDGTVAVEDLTTETLKSSDRKSKVVGQTCAASQNGAEASGVRRTVNIVQDSKYFNVIGDIHSKKVTITTCNQDEDFRAEIDTITYKTVETPALDSVKEKLQKTHFVVITGCPGSGKTVLAYMALKTLAAEGYIPKILRFPDDFKSSLFRQTKLLIFVDDIFGQVCFDQSGLRTMDKFLELLMQMIQKDKLKAICTSRLSILKEAEPFLDKFQSLFGNKSRIDLSNQEYFPLPVMRKMLLTRLEGSDIELSRSVVNSITKNYDIRKATHGFPHCCELLLNSEQAQRDPKYFFDHPIKMMKETLTAIIATNETIKKVFKYMITQNGTIDESNFGNEKADLKQDELRTVIHQMDGSFLRKEKSLVRFKHPSLYECTAAIIGKIDPDFVLTNAKLEYISYHVKVQDEEIEDEDSIDLTLNTDYTKHVQRRFVAEIKDKKFTLLFRHHLWKEKDFTASAIEAVVKECGPDLITTFDGSRTSLLHWSARSRSSMVLTYILDQFDVREELKLDALYGCLVWSNVEGLEFILKTLHPAVIKRKFYGKSALAHIAGYGTEEMCKALIAKGIDIHAKDDDSGRAVHLAAAAGNVRVLKTLIDAGCDVNAMTDGDTTPLHLAVLYHRPETVKCLVEANCKIDTIARYVSGMDPSRREIYITHKHTFPFLISGTPLYFACLSDDPKIAKILLDGGADANIANDVGITPLHVCNIDCLRFLLQTHDYSPEIHEKIFTSQALPELSDVEFSVCTPFEIIAKMLEVLSSFIHSPFDSAFHNCYLKTVLEFLSLKPELNKWVLSFKNSQDSLVVDTEDLHKPLPNDYTILHVVVLSQKAETIKDLLKYPGVDVNARSRTGLTPFHMAVLVGNVEIVSLLKEAGADTEFPSPLYNLPILSLAALEGSIGVVKYLLENGADIHQRSVFGSTALFWAIISKAYEAAVFLIESGADVNVESKGKMTPLHAATTLGAEALVDVLIKHKASVNITSNIGESPLITATFYDHEEIVDSLIRAGAEVNCQGQFGNYSSLHVAALSGYHKTAKLLLKAKSNPHLLDKNGDTPLTIVATRGHENIMKLLLEYSAKVNHQNNEGKTPLMKAINNDNSILARQLVCHPETDINLCDKDGYTALHHTCIKGQTDIAELILNQDSDINIIATNGGTPLMIASAGGYSDIVFLLLNASADVNLTTDYGITPLYIASKSGHMDIVQALIGAGANVDVDLMEAKTPLMVSSQYGHRPVVECLLQANADANLRDNNGHTALHWACSGKHETIVQILLNMKTTDEETKGSSAEQNLEIDVKNHAGNTPLILAAVTDNLNNVTHLLESGANADMINRDGKSALTAAVLAGCTSVVEKLFKVSGDEIKDKVQVLCFVKLAKGNVVSVIQHLLDSGTDVNTRDEQGKTALLVAVEQEHLGLMEVLLEASADVNAPDHHGKTPLFAAAKLGNKDIVERLVNKNAEIDVIIFNGQTPLNVSAKCGHVDVVQFLIQNGGDINIVDFEGYTPLTRAVTEGHDNIFHVIISSSVNLNLDALMINVAVSGNENMLHLLLEKGADINYMTEKGKTPLMVAITNGHASMADILVNHPEIHLRLLDKDKSIALHYACRHQQIDLVNMILQRDASVDVVAMKDGTPLLVASFRGYTNIVECLLNASADPNLKSDYGFTPLHSAARMGHLDIVRMLIESKADVNTNFVEGRTPLIVASMRGHVSVVEYLLAAEADVSVHDDGGLTALHWACSGKHMAVVELLLRISNGESEAQTVIPKFDVNIRCTNGNTPLILATKANAAEIVTLLIESGADVDIINNYGQSAITVAISSGFILIVEKLFKVCGMAVHETMKEICLVKLVENSSSDMIRHLVQSGVSVNAGNKTGTTPLIAAVEQEDIELLGLFLETSADVNMGDHFGKTPLYTAAILGNKDIVELLIKAGAEIDVIFFNGRTPLNVSAENGHIDVVKFLLQKGADVNVVDFEGLTSLARAVYKGHTDVVHELLDAGVDKEGLEIAINSSRSEVITTILYTWLCM